MKQAKGLFTLIVRENNAVVDFNQASQGIGQRLRKILTANRIDTFGEQRHPALAFRPDYFRPSRWCFHGDQTSTMRIKRNRIPNLVYALYGICHNSQELYVITPSEW